MSLAMIAAVGALAVGATTSFFSDTETSVGNTFTAGTIDISVDEENPWASSWSNFLDKPCQVSYMTFVIENVGENPANIWKKLTNVKNGPGDTSYCGASSEPEYTEGGGIFEDGTCVDGDNNEYTERDNLSAFMVYDMAICKIPVNRAEIDSCPFIINNTTNPEENKKPDLEKTDVDGNRLWTVLIDENDQVRIDNVVDTWVKLNGKLAPGEKLVVSQSYHLMAWDDSGEAMITNWAQGDVMNFDVQLEARQLTAPAPGVSEDNTSIAKLTQKDTSGDVWTALSDGAKGTLTYKVEGATFDYSFTATGLTDNADYSLIYYGDPYPGNHPGALIANYTADSSGEINDVTGSTVLGIDLPEIPDANYGVGAKVWLVLAADYDEVNKKMSGWNPSQYLVDDGTLVNYDYN